MRHLPKIVRWGLYSISLTFTAAEILRTFIEAAIQNLKIVRVHYLSVSLFVYAMLKWTLTGFFFKQKILQSNNVKFLQTLWKSPWTDWLPTKQIDPLQKGASIWWIDTHLFGLFFKFFQLKYSEKIMTIIYHLEAN